MMQKYLSKRLKGRSGGRVQSALFNLELKSHIYLPDDLIWHMWLMMGQKSAKCDRRVCRVRVTLENAFVEKKHSVTNVTSVTLWPCTNVTNVFAVTRVTNVTQICDPVTQIINVRVLGEKKYNVTNVTSVSLWLRNRILENEQCDQRDHVTQKQNSHKKPTTWPTWPAWPCDPETN